MSIGLKLFWSIIFLIILGGLGYVTFFGVPSPKVDVRHQIDLSNRFK